MSDARFWENVMPEPNSGCWLWIGAWSNAGRAAASRYGQHLGEGAHRFAYRTFVGAIPGGVHVLHRCDIGPCVNPRHLFLGTAVDNATDMLAKGRGGHQRYPKRYETVQPRTPRWAWYADARAEHLRTKSLRTIPA